ncbi:hypothetical protein Desdi_0131 [Desulfitobacterium dichloroeliminans LMG P-21439]|uniref:Uncharacterized protein n=1 Tax=Desulfitobacterium dichloroeliminans (strain LMG P-21439 / DCA1) TaxID=871963 RepID=L0F4U8_DESDL|nr:hypothetical protein [Desulfitobacterium dichloroeliminans]AGA67691.1 hypothetical protein Desdi_0131 [Desulfitobacterium dichloroeliminans LMG P-21439]
MKRKIPIDGLNTFGPKEKEEIKKPKPKKPPQLQKKIHYRKWGDAGVGIEISNYWVFRLVINGITIDEKDFEKLFPTIYKQFNVRTELKTNPKTGDFQNTIYLYFPRQMLEDMEIRIIYRDLKKKMLQHIYDLTVDKEDV